MSNTIHKLSDVFGLSRDVPLTYTNRDGVDDKFVDSLGLERHVVVHGSSKQGKTCLRRQHLKEEECVCVQCTRDTTKAKLYEMILKRAGVRVEVTSTHTDSSGTKSTGEGQLSGSIPWVAKAQVELRTERSNASTDSRSIREFDIDLNDPNDVARLLTEAQFDRFIVVEDFHYLDEEVQRSFSFDLKVFNEVSRVVFIIVGVWLEANRLVQFNGDLSGRLTPVDADNWNGVELRRLVRQGETLLNIRLPDDVVDQIVKGCEGNVGLVQDICHRLCADAHVFQTQERAKTVGKSSSVVEFYGQIAEEQSARYLNFLGDFAEGLGKSKLNMYAWILHALVGCTPAELRRGVKSNVLFQKIKSIHPEGENLQPNNLQQALKRVHKVQHRQKVQPVVLDYSENRLCVVDSNFIVFARTQELGHLEKAIKSRMYDSA